MNEAASSTPKNTWGIRLFNEGYREIKGQYRDLAAARVLYGVTTRLSVMATATVSNHHSESLPPEFPDHNTPQIGVKLPFLFDGVDFYAKYRFISSDRQNSHLRVAAWAEYGLLKVAHDEAEPNLMEDTRGFGAGLICTYLKDHFAASFNGGYVLPSSYRGNIPDYIPSLPGVPAKVVYGNAVNYNLSLGYLLLPRKYTGYDQTNLNLYVEFMGKSYDAAQVFLANVFLPGRVYEVKRTDLKALGSGQYIDVYPGIQLICKSALRIDASVGLPLAGKSYTHFYPVYVLGVQRYLFPNHKKK